MQKLRAAFGRGGSDSLDVTLKKITDSGILEVPEELLNVVVEASATEDGRRTIMKLVQEVLKEPKGIRWRRVHAALILVEFLLKGGSDELVVETAEGLHFDLVQRLSLLQHFENTADARAQDMVRKKATAVRSLAVDKLQHADERAVVPKDTASTGAASVLTVSTAASSAIKSFSNEDAFVVPERQAGQLILNGVVAVGHSDDTTSESSGGEGQAQKAVQYREQKRSSRSARNQAARSRGSSSDSIGHGAVKLATQPTTSTAPFAPTTNLLDF